MKNYALNVPINKKGGEERDANNFFLCVIDKLMVNLIFLLLFFTS